MTVGAIRHVLAAFVALAVSLTSASAAVAEAPCVKPRRHPFRMYEALAYRDTPDFAAYGISKINVPDHGFWKDEKLREDGDPARIRTLVAALPPGKSPIALDIEHFKMGWRDAEAPVARRRLIAIADAFRAAAPSRPVGFYGIIPVIDYWRAIKTWPGEYENWQRDNDFAKPLDAHVDILFPSIYTFYKDRAGWVRNAEEQICAARRLSRKPVVVFLWPEYHESTPFAGQPVEADYWALQLDTAHRLADGVVIWGGYDLKEGRARIWDSPPWWQATVKALAKWKHKAKR